MEGRAKYGYMSCASIPLKIQSGEIDAYDIVYTTDTHENYVISPDLEPWAVRSRIYVFDSVENANTLLNVNTDTGNIGHFQASCRPYSHISDTNH